MREGSYNDSVGLGSCTERNDSFYAKIKVSTFVNFVVDRLKKKKKKKKKIMMMMMKKSAF